MDEIYFEKINAKIDTYYIFFKTDGKKLYLYK